MGLFKIGDRVTLESGGDSMMVSDVRGEEVRCDWMSHDTHLFQTIFAKKVDLVTSPNDGGSSRGLSAIETQTAANITEVW
ncbi:MAG: DUF2158 domain-containing protein [Acidobacteriota bacterium]